MEESKNPKKGKLFLVSTPIGNDDDISMRAIKVMNHSDLVVCEEPKVGARMLKKYNIAKTMDLLNENNEPDKTQELLASLRSGKTVSLVSDAGTPVFADPGFELVKACLRNNIDISAVPGPTSIMAALVVSGFPIKQFLYGGFLHRDNSVRLKQIEELSNEDKTVVILETPYRMLPVLEAFVKIIPDRRAYIGCNLTMPHETHHYGTFDELLTMFIENHFKGEFVIVFEGNYREGAKSEFNDTKSQKKFISKDSPRSDSPRRGARGGGDRRSAPRRHADRADRKANPNHPKSNIDKDQPNSETSAKRPDAERHGANAERRRENRNDRNRGKGKNFKRDRKDRNNQSKSENKGNAENSTPQAGQSE